MTRELCDQVCSSRRKRDLSRSIRGERLGGQSALFIPSSAPYLLFISFFLAYPTSLLPQRCRRYPMTEPSQSQRTDSGLTIFLDAESTWASGKRDRKYVTDSIKTAGTINESDDASIVTNFHGFIFAMDEPC